MFAFFNGCSATVNFSIHNGNDRSMHVLNSFDFHLIDLFNSCFMTEQMKYTIVICAWIKNVKKAYNKQKFKKKTFVYCML